MRNLLLFLVLVSSLNLTHLVAQPTIVTTPQHKNVVMEEYTGIHCGYCPDGHIRAEEILSSHPGRVVLINIHAGSFSAPQVGEPDFRTIFGEILATDVGVSGYPSGTINRHIFPEIINTPAMGRSNWAYAAEQIFPLQSPVNVGYSSYFDTITRELTVNAEVYYTASSPVSSNFLQIALLENHVYGYQSDYANGTNQNYDHKYILRHFLTGQWGYEITSTSQGSFFTETFSYTIPADYDINNCDIAIYVSEGHFEVYTGVKGIANGGSNNGETSTYIGDLIVDGNQVEAASSGSNNTFVTTMSSSLAGDEDFEVKLYSDNAPNDWSASYFYDGVEYNSPSVLTLSNYVASEFTIYVSPGVTNGFVKYTLEISSVNLPNAESRKIDVYVVKGITDLIVNGTGGWGDGGSYNFNQNIIDGLDFAGNNSYALVDGNIFSKSMESNSLDDVNNIYLNIGWRFPSFSDYQALAIMDFMDTGGNVFVAGQDIGWDIGSGSGYGTTITSELYSDYFHAEFNDDGGSSNTELTAVSTDEIFGTLSSSGIIDVYNGNFYPDQVNPIGDAVTIFNYNGVSSKSAGIRYQNSDYKVVYLCVDLAMLADADVQKDLIKRTHDWFYAPDEIENLLVNSSLEIFPNPANEELNILINSDEVSEFLIEVLNVSGQVILKTNFQNRSKYLKNINISELKSGVYFIKMMNKEEIRIIRFEKI